MIWASKSSRQIRLIVLISGAPLHAPSWCRSRGSTHNTLLPGSGYPFFGRAHIDPAESLFAILIPRSITRSSLQPQRERARYYLRLCTPTSIATTRLPQPVQRAVVLAPTLPASSIALTSPPQPARLWCSAELEGGRRDTRNHLGEATETYWGVRSVQGPTGSSPRSFTGAQTHTHPPTLDGCLV